MKERFELNKKYRFDPTDLVAVLYVIATACTIAGLAKFGSWLLFIGACISLISTAIFARRLNLFVIGITIFVLDLYFILA